MEEEIGSFGPSKEKVQEEEAVLHDVRLTAKQLIALSRFLDDLRTP